MERHPIRQLRLVQNSHTDATILIKEPFLTSLFKPCEKAQYLL
jgi:hypothetical protein